MMRALAVGVQSRNGQRASTAKTWLALAIIFVACLFFAVRGYQDQEAALQSLDFKPLYAGAICLRANCNPYDGAQLRTQFLQHKGDLDPKPFSPYYSNYPPSSLFLIEPFTLFDWPTAHVLWLTLLIGTFVGGVFAVADLALAYSPLASALAIAAMVVSSLLMVMLAQPAAVAIGLCCIGTWSFLLKRALVLGSLAFALSLALKPHLGGALLLYFLLAGGAYRRRSVHVILCTLVLSAPGMIWATYNSSSRSWVHDLGRNLQGISQHGNLSDPTPLNPSAHEMVNLQPLIDLAWNNVKVGNVTAWLITAGLALLWGRAALRLKDGTQRDYLCVAAIVSISLLPIYHRAYDTRLLLLTVPAASLLLVTYKKIGVAAFGLLAMTVVMTFPDLFSHPAPGLVRTVLTSLFRSGTRNVLVSRPASFACLLNACFYTACCYGLSRTSTSHPAKTQNTAKAADPAIA